MVEPAVRDRSTVIALIESLRNPEADVAMPPDAGAFARRMPKRWMRCAMLFVMLMIIFIRSCVRRQQLALGQLKDVRAIDALVHATRDALAEASEKRP